MSMLFVDHKELPELKGWELEMKILNLCNMFTASVDVGRHLSNTYTSRSHLQFSQINCHFIESWPNYMAPLTPRQNKKEGNSLKAGNTSEEKRTQKHWEQSIFLSEQTPQKSSASPLPNPFAPLLRWDLQFLRK